MPVFAEPTVPSPVAALSPLPPSPAIVRSTPPPPVRPPAVTPLSPDRYKLQLTISADMLDKLKLAKDMLSHAVPSGDDAAILDRALTALLEQLARKKFASTRRPRQSQGPSNPSDISAKVKRIVWVRDCGRCTFVGASGHRCHERRFVQFHHIVPRALGGRATPDQITLRCASHNQHEGRLEFGDRRRDGAGTVHEPAPSYGFGVVTQRVGPAAEHVPEHVGGWTRQTSTMRNSP
jgi:hypothetical protein